MNVTLRADVNPDVVVRTVNVKGESAGEICSVAMLEKNIRVLQIARRWLLDERKRKAEQVK